MSPKKQRRLAFAIVLVVAGATAAALIVAALNDNVQFFYSPSDIAARPPSTTQSFRVGGLVQTGSLVHGQGLEVQFLVTDGAHTVPVRFTGVLPDLFREGQGVVALGKRGPDGVVSASEVLAKHDERYMPPEVVDALKRAGRWKEGEGLAPGSGS